MSDFPPIFLRNNRRSRPSASPCLDVIEKELSDLEKELNDLRILMGAFNYKPSQIPQKTGVRRPLVMCVIESDESFSLHQSELTRICSKIRRFTHQPVRKSVMPLGDDGRLDCKEGRFSKRWDDLFDMVFNGPLSSGYMERLEEDMYLFVVDCAEHRCGLGLKDQDKAVAEFVSRIGLMKSLGMVESMEDIVDKYRRPRENDQHWCEELGKVLASIPNTPHDHDLG